MQLFVEGQNLVNLDFFTVSDPQCTFKTRECNASRDTEFKLAGETEVIDNNLNPLWIEHFTVLYSFKKDIELYFQVWNYNTATQKDLIGEVKLKLSEIMMSPGLAVTKTLMLPDKPDKSRGLLKIRGDKIKNTEDRVKFQLCANLKTKKFLCLGANNPYLLVERARNIGGEFGKEEHDQKDKGDDSGENESWYKAELGMRKKEPT